MRRRTFLQGTGAVGLLSFASPLRVRALLATAAATGADGHFLTAHELDTLRALLDRLLPGPPNDTDPGALDAKVPEAIDLYLGAFAFDPPLIHTGGPFSGRAGGGTTTSPTSFRSTGSQSSDGESDSKDRKDSLSASSPVQCAVCRRCIAKVSRISTIAREEPDSRQSPVSRRI